MRVFEFVPSICEASEGVEPKFTGYVKLKRLGFDKRCQIAEESGLDVTDLEELKASGKSVLSLIRKAVSLTKDCFEEVNLKRLSDGAVFSSYDDLDLEPDLASVLTESAIKLIRGDTPEKKSQTP